MARCEYSTSGSTCSQTRRRCLRGQNAGAKSDLCRCGLQKLSQVYICLPGFNIHCPAVLRSLIKWRKRGWYMSVCISGIKNGGNLPENMLHLQPTGVVVSVAAPFLAQLPVFPDNILDCSLSTCSNMLFSVSLCNGNPVSAQSSLYVWIK